jgi:hypothetical protein
MKLFIGKRTKNGAEVFIDGEQLTLEPSLEVYSHSPTGFEWGYGGSGPSQLALAILLELYGRSTALHYYQAFKYKFIVAAAQDGFVISSDDIDLWLKKEKGE